VHLNPADVHSSAQLELKPPEQWQQHFLNLLLLDQDAQQQQKQKGQSITSGAQITQRLHIKPQSVDNAITALEEWEARVEPAMLQAFNVSHLPIFYVTQSHNGDVGDSSPLLPCYI
jgi:DMSO/TMAO reductase YedYZ molybdopterin-dependent catalytic subunit